MNKATTTKTKTYHHTTHEKSHKQLKTQHYTSYHFRIRYHQLTKHNQN